MFGVVTMENGTDVTNVEGSEDTRRNWGRGGELKPRRVPNQDYGEES